MKNRVISLTLSFICSLNLLAQSKIPALPSLSSLLSNTNQCGIALTYGNSNKIIININGNTEILKKILNELKLTNANSTKMFRKVDSLLSSYKNSNQSSIVVANQYMAAQYLDTLTSIYLAKDKSASAKANIFSITSQTSQLRCIQDLETIEFNGSVYFLADKKDISREEITLFETKNPDNRLLFKYRNKFGYVDSTGSIVIPPQYDTALAFSESLAYVNRDKVSQGFIDVNNRFVIDLGIDDFDMIGSFHNGLARTKKKFKKENLFRNRYNYIDKHGKFISDSGYFYAADFTFGLGCVSSMVEFESLPADSLDENGFTEWLNPCLLSYFSEDEEKEVSLCLKSYEDALNFLKDLREKQYQQTFKKDWKRKPPKNMDDLLLLAEKDRSRYYSPFGGMLMDSIAKHKEAIGVIRRKMPLCTYIDTAGKIAIAKKFLIAEPFEYYNTARVTLSKGPQDDSTRSFLIDRSGKMKGDRWFPFFNYSEDNAWVAIKPFEGIYSNTMSCTIDTAGSIYFCTQTDSITEVRGNFIIVQDTNGLQGLLSISGLLILPFDYSRISFASDEICIAESDQRSTYYLLNPVGKAVPLKNLK